MWFSPLRGRLRKASQSLRRHRLGLEILEDRTLPASFTVTNLNDAGFGSLRNAIGGANNLPGPDVIVFQPGLAGTLTLTSGPLQVTDSVTIAGPGAGALTISGNNLVGIFLVDDGKAAVQNVAISGLTLTQGAGSAFGAAVHVGNENLVLSDMVIRDNSAGFGGGISVGPGGRLALVHSSVENNHATMNRGGGLYLDASVEVVIRNSTITGNTAAGAGGALSLGGNCVLTVEDTTISGNRAAGNGGGIDIDFGTVVVRDSTISGNTALGGAGALITGGGSLTVENSTLSGNSAVVSGGGIILLGAMATIRNSTIAFNTTASADDPTGRGGGIFAPAKAASTVTLQGTIVARNNRGTAGARDDIFGPVATLVNSLIGDITGLTGVAQEGGEGTNGNLLGNAAAPLDPLLAPLADNGGPTQTHALLPGSPAIDAGFNFSGQSADQRGAGFARTVGPATDMGASEVQPPPPPRPSPIAPPALPARLPVVEIRTQRVKGRTRVDVTVDGTVRQSFFPFGAFKGHVQVQQMDGNGDGMLHVVSRATINGKVRARTFIT